jgi:hypothetical protein
MIAIFMNVLRKLGEEEFMWSYGVSKIFLVVFLLNVGQRMFFCFIILFKNVIGIMDKFLSGKS